MNENINEGGAPPSPLETQTGQNNEDSDRAARTEVKSKSRLSGGLRRSKDLILIIWLLFLFAVATWSVVGSLTAHVLQSRFYHVLNSQTPEELEHIFVQYLRLKDAIGAYRKVPQKQKDGAGQAGTGGETKDSNDPLSRIAKLLKKSEDGAISPDLLYLARAHDSLEGICIPYSKICLSGFVQTPKQLLILVLTISMGVLGSLMRITRNFFDREADQEEMFSWYFFRPFLGAITALAVLILLKAGQLTITNASVGLDNESLNPYFISFIAIISGFLSVQAHDRIRRAGAAIFGTSQSLPVSRWLVQSRLNSLGSKDLLSLASYLSVSGEKVQQWFDLQEAVPESAQPIVAAWLDEPQQILFTDLRPQNKGISKANSGTAASEEKPDEIVQSQAQRGDTTRKAGDATYSKRPLSFAPSQTKDRWLILDQVQSLIGSRQLSGLAHHADVSEETVDAWLHNKEPVPPNFQLIVGAWLDAPDRATLFTETKPRIPDNDPGPKE